MAGWGCFAKPNVMRNSKSGSGVSLAELLIAMAVIAIGMSGVAASLYYGQRQSQHGDELAKASQYAKTLIELCRARSFAGSSTLDGDGLPNEDSGINDNADQPPRELSFFPYEEKDFLGYWTDVEADQDNSAREMERFTRHIRMERISAEGEPNDALARMTVTVYWEAKSEGGKNHVTLSALIPMEPRSALW